MGNVIRKLKKECKECAGTGALYTGSQMPCIDCKGEGLVFYNRKIDDEKYEGGKAVKK
jgi:DnaJ-class molecular chaperone